MKVENPMHIKNNYTLFFPLILFLFLSFLSGCKKKEAPNIQGEYIYRKKEWVSFSPPPPIKKELPSYAWDKRYCGRFPRITKEFFRCRGNPLNAPAVKEKENKERVLFRDCQGGDHHGLPIRNGKEFIYPALIDLLNFVQEKTGKRVVITTGHRCPEHNTYCDYTPANYGSKHMMGAEVDFYVEGMEKEPEKIISLLQSYYKEKETFKGDKGYEKFERYEKKPMNVATAPWYNKEIFIKLYHPTEGRDADNLHAYPYIGVQVRMDRETKEPIRFDDKAARNYLRY